MKRRPTLIIFTGPPCFIVAYSLSHRVRTNLAMDMICCAMERKETPDSWLFRTLQTLQNSQKYSEFSKGANLKCVHYFHCYYDTVIFLFGLYCMSKNSCLISGITIPKILPRRPPNPLKSSISSYTNISSST